MFSVMAQLLKSNFQFLMFLREVISEAAGKQQIQMDHVLIIPSRYSFNYNFFWPYIEYKYSVY